MDSGSETESWETASTGSSGLNESDTGLQFSRPPSLLPVPLDASCQGDELCDTCKALELNPKRFVVLPGDKEWMKQNEPDDITINLGKVEDMAKRTNCPLCRLVLISLGGDKVPNYEDGEPVVAELSWNTDGPKLDPSAPWSHQPEVRLLRPYARTESGGFVQSVRLNLFPEITLLANDSPTSSTSYFVRPICREKIDFSLVRRWLSTCHMNHETTCRINPVLQELKRSHPADQVPDFRCIDVEENCLARTARDDRYAALSYVWGRRKFFRTLEANVTALEKPGALDKPEYWTHIPPTIKDAMLVAKEIGLRYIWVDSLCIVQDDTTGNKLEAIKMMDLVYAAADVVIVAAGSVDAYSGIPGVYPGTRGPRQPIEEIAPGFRLAFKTRWQDTIEDAAYYTRGWTFQETHFATRSLVFLNGKVTLRCEGGSDREEHLFEPQDEGGGGGGGAFEGDDIGQFEGLIQTYSERVLSFDSDVYNAFAGVARQLSFRMQTVLCHGIPARYFDWFLLWGPLGDQVRRPNAPSWSWAGWVGGSFPRIWDWYNRSIRRINRAIRKRTWIIWYQRQGHDSTHCDLIFEHDDYRAGSAEKRNFYGGKVLPRFGLDCSQTEPTERTLSSEGESKPPTYETDILSRRPGSGLLQFWTVSLTLLLGETASAPEDVGPRHNRRQLGIFGSSGRELGTISVQQAWFDQKSIPREEEFILICEGRDKRAEGGRIDDEDGWRYMAMLIEWHGEYAERVAIGSIGKGDLGEGLGGGGCWKEIILG